MEQGLHFGHFSNWQSLGGAIVRGAIGPDLEPIRDRAWTRFKLMIISGPHERKICWIWRNNPYKIKTKRIISNNYYGKIIYNGMCFIGSVYHWVVLSLSGIQRIISLLMNTIWPHLTFLRIPRKESRRENKIQLLVTRSVLVWCES